MIERFAKESPSRYPDSFRVELRSIVTCIGRRWRSLNKKLQDAKPSPHADVKLRFQADADLNESIVRGVLRRNPKIDFQDRTGRRLAKLEGHASPCKFGEGRPSPRLA